MALWQSFEAPDSDHDEYDSDDFESAAVHPLEANLPQNLRHGLTLRAFYALVGSALDELAPDPEAPSLLDTGLAELASFIDVLSRSSISGFTSTLFDSIRAEAEEAAREWGDDGTRSRCILHLARVIDYAFPPSGLVGSGCARRAVQAARRAALEGRREEGAVVAALEEQKRRGPEGARVAALDAKKRRVRVAALEAKERRT